MNACQKPLYQAILLSSALGFSSLALAVDPAPIKMGAIDLFPTLKLDASQDDNIFRAPNNREDSIITVVAPKLQAVLEQGASLFSLDLELFEGDYEETSEDDYTDWRIAGSAHIELNSQNIFDLSISEFETHEPRGTGFSEGDNIPTVPDEYDESRYDISYQIGNNQSLARLVFSVGGLDKEYSNNFALTQFRDRETDKFGAALYLNLSPRTALLFEYRHAEIDYDTDPAGGPGILDTLDNEEDYVYVGIEWEATAAISGSLRIGQGEKDFDDADRKDLDEPSFDAALTWQPVSYSTFNLTASSLFDETNGAGDAIDRETISLNWQHDWSNRFSTILSYTTTDEDYGGIQRKDELDYYSVGLKYAFSRWLDFHLEFIQDDKDSTENRFEYDRPVFAFGFELSL